MDLKKLYEKYIYRTACCFFLSSAAAVWVNAYSGALLNNTLVVFFALFFSAAAVPLDIFKRKPVLYITFGSAAAALFAFIFFLEIPFFETINSALVWRLYDRIAGENAFEYALISSVFFEAAAAAVLFMLMKFKYARYTVGAGVLLTVIILAFTEHNVEKTAVFFIFAFLFAVALEIALSGLSYRHGTAYLLPFILIAGLITAILPSSDAPIQWNSVKSIISNIQTLVYKIGDSITLFFNSDSLEFGLSMTGFSEDGRIADGLKYSEGEALRIRKAADSGKSLYITGTVMDRYTGKGWERTDSFTTDNENGGLSEYEFDLLQTLTAFYKNGLLDEDEIFKERDIEVFYRGLRTRSMFYPLKTMKINSSFSPEIKSGNMFLNGVSDEKTSYHLRYLDVDYSDARTIGLLRSITPDSDEMNAELLRDIKKKTGAISIAEIPADYNAVLKSREENIKKVYTQLPDTVRSEVYELTENITAGYSNDYDKLAALESFLSSGFKYTLSPSAPESGELTYSLVFETGEGYCTYFATAFAVMARTLGIPARFVQGYVTDFSEKTDGNLYVIRNKNAHAWAEAYISGIGWIPFEPTPGFSAARYPEWEKKKKTPPIRENDLGSYYNPAAVEEQIPGIIEETDKDSGNGALLSLIITAGVLLTAVTAAVTFTFIVGAYRKRKKLNINNAKAYYMENFRYIMLFLKNLGYEPCAGETVKNFASRLKNERLHEIIPAHQKVRYAEENPSAEELEKLMKYKEELAERVRLKKGRLRYYALIYR